MRAHRGALLIAAAALFSSLAAGEDAPPMMGGAAPERRPVVHDPAYFRDKVLPLLDRHCIACHDAGDKENKSKNRLEPRGANGKWTDDAVEANYKNVVRFLNAQLPERSTVLAKLTPVS